MVSPTSTLCPDFELTIMNEDDSELDGDVFLHDPISQELIIDTKDVSYADTYDLKLVASFTEQYS